MDDPCGPEPRPAGVTALSIFFSIGSAIAFTSGVSLLFPGSLLEPMWRINPRAREAFTTLGPWAVALLAAVSLTCAASAIGLWRGARWSDPLALGLLMVNLVGDILNVLLGTEPRAAIGIPIGGALLAYLSTRRVRRFFAGATG